MRRWLLGGFGLLATLVAVDLVVAEVRQVRPVLPIRGWFLETGPPIVVGLIHSQTGPLAISERSLIDAEVLALEEIQARGGIAGRAVTWEVADGRSEPGTFADLAARLIEKNQASMIVGGWSAECRKALLGVIEKQGSLLIFPSNYEGIERSSHAIYSGGSANQVVLPTIRWCFDSLKARRFFVVGTEEIWSRVVVEIAKDAIKASGGELVGERYLPIVGGDAQALPAAIQAAGGDVVINALVGDSNISFFSAIRRAGLTPDKMPVVAFNVSEDEMKRFPPGDLTGHYAAWNYFQSIDRPENAEFVRKFKARYGQDRVVGDSMVAAYSGIMLWAQAAAEARTGDPKAVSTKFDRQSYNAPEGVVTIDPASRTAWRPFFLGKARDDGQFDVVWSLTKPNCPVQFVATRPKASWVALVESLRVRWGGHWSSTEVGRPEPTRPPG